MATELGQVYKCNVCGNIVIMVHAGAGSLVCCGEDMKLQTENTVDAAKEKHVPVISRDGDNLVVNVGAVPHPMEEKHYIEWIEAVVGDKVYTKMLKPGDAPVASFCLCDNKGKASVRAYCNLHGLWAAAE